MITEFFQAAKAYLDILPLLSKFKLWRYILWSGVISLILGSSIFYLSYSLSDHIGQAIISRYPFEFGRGVLAFVSNFIGGAVFFFGGLFLYKYLVLIILSPLLSFISEKLEANLSGGPVEKVRFSFSGMISDFLRGLRIALRNVFRELLFTVLIIITGFLPVINIFTAPMLFLLQAYYAGFGNMDFYLERHLRMKPTIHFVHKHKGLAMGNGSIFILLLMIPGLGLILAPTLATIAASFQVHPYFQSLDNQTPQLV